MAGRLPYQTMLPVDIAGNRVASLVLVFQAERSCLKLAKNSNEGVVFPILKKFLRRKPVPVFDVEKTAGRYKSMGE
jgi:hypothetical protein